MWYLAFAPPFNISPVMAFRLHSLWTRRRCHGETADSIWTHTERLFSTTLGVCAHPTIFLRICRRSSRRTHISTSMNLLTSSLEPPKAKHVNLPPPDLPQQEHHPNFKLPLWPASAYREDIPEHQHWNTGGFRALDIDTEPGEITRPDRDRSPAHSSESLVQQNTSLPAKEPPSPYDTQAARRLRRKMPHFAIDNPASGLTTYGPVPTDPRIVDLSQRPFMEIHQNSVLTSQLYSAELLERDWIWAECVEIIGKIRKERNS